MNLRNVVLAPALAGAITLCCGGAWAATPSPYAKQAKITMAQARAIALKAVPGAKFVDSELEKEKGGSGLRYSFDVKVNGQAREIGVDAVTGKILENSAEGANPD